MANWLPDLAGRPGPRYQAIVDALAEDIRSGRLAAGTRLPPHRDLAWRLKVTVGTVARAYGEAERLGLVSGEVGRGTFVRDGDADPSVGDLFSVHALGGGDVVDMAVNRPSGDNNAAELAAAVRAAVARPDLPAMLTYHLEQSPLRHRLAAAAWLGRFGLEVPAEQVTLTAGGQQAIIAALAAVSRPGDRILCDEFTYPGMKSAAGILNRHLLGLRSDADGICPDALDKALSAREGRVVYVISSGNNPTTATMSEERRRAFVEVARRHDAIIIEDGIYAFLNPDAPPPIASFAPERTVYLTSVSKSVSPGLRIGFVAAPAGFVGRIAGNVGATTLMVPAIMAEAAALMIEDGTAARCAERQYAEATVRRDLATQVLGSGYCQPRAAFNLWLPLPAPWRADDFVAEARRNGVALTPAASFAVGRPRYEAVRISISAPVDREELGRGLRILAGMLRVSADNCSMTV